MKKSILIVSIVTLGYFVISSFNNGLSRTKQEVSLEILMTSLRTGHYAPVTVDDSLSVHVYDLYIKRLDYSKSFFTESDIEKLSAYKYLIDDEINERSFEFFDLSCELIRKRISENESSIETLLKKPFDFSKEDSIQSDPDLRSYASNIEELKKRWYKTLKYQTLIQYTSLVETQEKAKENKDTSITIKTLNELEEEAREKVLKNNKEYFERMSKVTDLDRYNLFLNTIANVFDPHTEFFPPKQKKNFDISMSGQLEGIGAQLQEKDGYVKVTRIVPGSASSRQGQLEAGHIILKVGQGSEEPVSIVGMRLDDAVELIRGKKGTEVRLTVKDLDGSIFEIPIIRDVVILEETYAQSMIIDGKKKVGYIRLPVFYADFAHTGKGRHSSQDVKKEIRKLKEEGVEGIILDLRNNGGGSLHDAIDMAGLFIKQGPIVQVKAGGASPTVLKDRNPLVEYDGPLIVMVNYNSASASEIVAAALQDYERAIIVGSPGTFGKGTVQRFLNMDDYLINAFDTLKPLGSLKITFQKFYRINGGSTQLKGVTPDIVFPDVNTYIETGEKDMDFPIAWDEIAPVEYERYRSGFNKDQLLKQNKVLAATLPAFKEVNRKAKELEKQRDRTFETLNYEKHVAEKKALETDNKQYEDIVSVEIPELKLLNPKVDLAAIKADSSKLLRNEDWIKALKKDIYLYQTAKLFELNK